LPNLENSRTFQTHSNAHQHSDDEKLNPGLREAATDWGEDAEDGGQEDSTTATNAGDLQTLH